MNETVELVNKLILIITPIVMTIFISWASWCIISHATAMMSAKTIEAKKEQRNAIIFNLCALALGLLAPVIVLALRHTIANSFVTNSVINLLCLF